MKPFSPAPPGGLAYGVAVDPNGTTPTIVSSQFSSDPGGYQIYQLQNNAWALVPGHGAVGPTDAGGISGSNQLGSFNVVDAQGQVWGWDTVRWSELSTTLPGGCAYAIGSDFQPWVLSCLDGNIYSHTTAGMWNQVSSQGISQSLSQLSLSVYDGRPWVITGPGTPYEGCVGSPCWTAETTGLPNGCATSIASVQSTFGTAPVAFAASCTVAPGKPGYTVYKYEAGKWSLVPGAYAYIIAAGFNGLASSRNKGIYPISIDFNWNLYKWSCTSGC
jgi:hypothetical protein